MIVIYWRVPLLVGCIGKDNSVTPKHMAMMEPTKYIICIEKRSLFVIMVVRLNLCHIGILTPFCSFGMQLLSELPSVHSPTPVRLASVAQKDGSTTGERGRRQIGIARVDA